MFQLGLKGVADEVRVGGAEIFPSLTPGVVGGRSSGMPVSENVIPGIAFGILIDISARNGVPAETLIRGLDLSVEEIRKNPRRRHPWNDYVEVTDRMAAALGGYENLARAGEAMADVLPEFRAICSVFVSPRSLYRFVMLVADPVIYPTVTFQIEDVPGGRLLLTNEILPEYRESLSVQHAAIGAVRGVPRYIGLPLAHVEVVEITPRRSVFLIDPPVSKTVAARARRWLPSLFQREALREMLADKEELAETLTSLRKTSDALEARHRALEEEVSARRQLQSALARILETVSSAAFLVSADEVSGANASGVTAIEHEGDPLRACLRGIHRDGAVPDSFEVTATGAPGQLLVIRRGLGDEIRRRLGRAGERWSLTPRQVEVLHGLVDGLSNTDIAERLGCTVRTVEAHLTALLDRADSSSRLELVASFWTDG